MAMMYTEIPLQTGGMVCAARFSLPGDGCKVFFDIKSGGTFRKDIFVVLDGQLPGAPFVNGSRLERRLPGSHETFAVVVDRTEVLLDPIVLPVVPVPVTIGWGRNAIARIGGTLRTAIFPGDPAQLARDYAQGVVSDPLQTAAGTMKSLLQRAAADIIPPALAGDGVMHVVTRLDAISQELARRVVERTEWALPWCSVSACEVELTVENLDELVEASNVPENLPAEARCALLRAILATFGSGPLPEAVSRELAAYIRPDGAGPETSEKHV